jgi:chromosome segregation ATPase
MTATARKYEVEVPVEERIARLEVTTAHIQTDVTEIKARLERLDEKWEKKIGALDAKIDAIRTSLEARLDGLRASVDAKFDGFRGSVDAKFDDLNKRFTSLSEKISAQEASLIRWIVGTTIAAVSATFAIAKYFN